MHLVRARHKLVRSAFAIHWLTTILLGTTLGFAATNFPAAVERDFVLKDFRFHSGELFPQLRMHHRLLGTPRYDSNSIVTNAVLILHGTTGDGGNFMRPEFAGELFGPGQTLDANRYFLILPDNLGHGKSTKPSDGLHAKFPKYGYLDMVEAQRRLLVEGLDVKHLRLIIGTSMGGMHTWLWGQIHPEFMDALMPLASLPTQISGRNRVWRRIIMDSIRNDSGWNGGDYDAQPYGLKVAIEVLYFMSNNPIQRQKDAPTLQRTDELLDNYLNGAFKAMDANDVSYAVQSSYDYDPGPGLEKIRAPLLAVNFADDLINPPELGILEKEIRRVEKGRAVVIPLTEETRGHGTHTLATVWKRQLEDLLSRSEAK